MTFTVNSLFDLIKIKSSFLCVGLDTDINRIPEFLRKEKDAISIFNREIIDATKDICVAYKPNIAFYESLGSKGWEQLEKTLDYLPSDCFSIADAKRGDIGNTSRMYAKTFFENYDFDSVTVAPYMGSDSVTPFLEFENKWVILLALTSNKGSSDFQFTKDKMGQTLYHKVFEESQKWASTSQMMYVVGATHPEKFEEIRQIVPDHFLLVPGVGAQGGDLQKICKYGLNDHCGLLVNSSRGIIYAGDGRDFAEKARESALKLQIQMSEILNQRYA